MYIHIYSFLNILSFQVGWPLPAPPTPLTIKAVNVTFYLLMNTVCDVLSSCVKKRLKTTALTFAMGRNYAYNDQILG